MSTGPINPAPQPPRSGGGGMSVLVIVLIILGLLVLLCAGLCGGCVYAVRKGAESGAAYVELLPSMQRAESAVVSDPQVIAKLGEPVAMSGAFARDGSGELAPGGEDFHFTVQGPNGTGNVKATARQESGTWRVTTITVQTSDGSTFSVPPPITSAPDVRFDMPPTPEAISEPSEK